MVGFAHVLSLMVYGWFCSCIEFDGLWLVFLMYCEFDGLWLVFLMYCEFDGLWLVFLMYCEFDGLWLFCSCIVSLMVYGWFCPYNVL